MARYTVTVKLDLEVMGLKKRLPGSGLQRLVRLAQAGLARLPHRSPDGAEGHPLAVQQHARPEDSG